MKKEDFDEAKEINKQITEISYKIKHIDVLLKSCGLSCSINGTPPNQFRKTEPYHSQSKNYILMLLENDKVVLNSKLGELTDKFNAI